MNKALIRTMCFYLFTFIGLVVGLTLMVIGSVSMVDLGFRSFVFTEADKVDNMMFNRPIDPPIELGRIKQIAEEPGVLLTEEEALIIRGWLANYEEWQKAAEERDFARAQRSREISQNIAMILIGAPLYFYHWRLLKKDQKEKDE